jgi:hypothetical protein
MDPSWGAKLCAFYSRYSNDSELVGFFDCMEPHTELCSSHQNENTYLTEDWNAFIDSQPWEFEMDFWANLAEHPTLTG